VEAEELISKIKAMGLSSEIAEGILSDAKSEFSSGNYDEASKLAENAYTFALDVDQDGVINDEDFAPTIPNNYIYIGSFVMSVFLILLLLNAYKKWQQRKILIAEREKKYALEKMRLKKEIDEILK